MKQKFIRMCSIHSHSKTGQTGTKDIIPQSFTMIPSVQYRTNSDSHKLKIFVLHISLLLLNVVFYFKQTIKTSTNINTKIPTCSHDAGEFADSVAARTMGRARG